MKVGDITWSRILTIILSGQKEGLTHVTHTEWTIPRCDHVVGADNFHASLDSNEGIHDSLIWITQKREISWGLRYPLLSPRVLLFFFVFFVFCLVLKEKIVWAMIIVMRIISPFERIISCFVNSSQATNLLFFHPILSFWNNWRMMRTEEKTVKHEFRRRDENEIWISYLQLTRDSLFLPSDELPSDSMSFSLSDARIDLLFFASILISDGIP